MVNLGNDWDKLLKDEFQKEYYLQLRQFLIREYRTKPIYPDMYMIFEALKLTSYENAKVVILGQDPYHGKDQAHGLAFSVQQGIDIPPSLMNIYKELADDMGCYVPNNGYLVPWAKQGVLLLNTSLTVVANRANSHRNKGWENLTDAVIQVLNKKDAPVVYLLWGNNAKEKSKYLTNPKHLVLQSVHPSPLSANRGFFGCRHFSKTNRFLRENGLSEIDWQIPNI
ncbi:MAG: uracil-DNA glycosylase [Bacillota bacterium]|nr:uracil-DNA glycosylase [Bacillota bacterium]MDD4264648.1 uracil-DNA glycosylase [Bacillota bacterium]